MVSEKENEAVHMKSPGDRKRYRIDYILVKQQFRNSIRDVKILTPTADKDSDHAVLLVEVQTRLQAIKIPGKRKPK